MQDLIVAWAGLRVAGLFSAGRARPMAIVFWLFVYVWIGIAGLVQGALNAAPWGFAISAHAYNEAQIVVLVGLAAVEIAHTCAAKNYLGKTAAIGRPWLREVDPSRVFVLAVLVVIAAPAWVELLGGPHALFSSRQSLNQSVFGTAPSSLASGGLEIAFSTVPTFMALYGMLITGLWKRYRVLFALVVMATIVLNSPLAMPRFWLLTIAIALVFAIPRVRQSASAVRAVITVALVVSIGLFPYLSYFRLSSGFQGPSNIPSALSTSGDYDAFTMIAAGVQDTYSYGLRDGHQALGDILFFVPRSIWSGKANDTGSLVASDALQPYTNLSAPLWLEGYIDFGFVGVVAYLAFWGWLMRRADDLFVRGNSRFARFWVPLIAGYSGILLRGALLQSMARLAVMVGLIFLLSRRVPAQPAEPMAAHRSSRESESAGLVDGAHVLEQPTV